uniref:BED-type domain-containing protein n=1 Tax=Graphocephala atropunctata TaxID=36148 RepID=A0A1B6KMC0_9HEMI
MAPKKKSIVWKHFDKINIDTSVCRHCGKHIKAHSSTTNLISHLKSLHSDSLIENDCGDNTKDEGDLEYQTEVVVVNPNETLDSITRIAVKPKKRRSSPTGSVLNYEKLVVPMTMRSVYWKCFGFPADADDEILTKDKIVCLLCKTTIQYNRNTSNLRIHLQNRHPDELVQIELETPLHKPKETSTPKMKKVGKRLKDMGNMYSTVLNGSIDMSGNPVGVSNYIHRREGELLSHDGGKSVTLVVPGMGEQNCTIESLHPFMIPVESKNVSDAITEFIVMDMQQPDMVEGRGFQRLIATLKSPCEIPSKNKLVEEVIPRVYDHHKEGILEVVRNHKREVSLAVEEWESASGESYVTFSICYQIEGDDNINNRVLTTVHCPPNADSDFWNTFLDNLFAEWSIKIEKVKAIVCGSCRSDLINCILNKGLTLLPCLVHVLQDVCTKVCFEQDDVKDILSKCRAIIYLIYTHSNALAALRIQDHLMTLEETPLVADYPKVWISTYTMIEGLVTRRQIIPTILENVDSANFDRDTMNISEQDWALLEDVLSVLEPFKVTMMTLSEEKAPLMSLLKPLLWQLLSCHLQPKDEDSVNAQVFKVALKSFLSEKYSDPAVSKLLQIATTLDPRFKSLPNTTEESKIALDGPIKEALVNLIDESPGEIKVIVDETPGKKKPRLGMAMLLGDMSPHVSTNLMSTQDRANLEIVQYQSEPTATLDQCPVTWWGRIASKCPHLSRIAAQYMCVPATTLPPARIPAEAHIAYHIKRANLSTETVDRMLFLHSNHAV